MLTARKLVQSKLLDIEMSLRGVLRGFGLKVGATKPNRFGGRIEELVSGHATLETVAKALLAAHEVLLRELKGFEKRVRAMARDDERVRLLMSTPGVGAIVGLTYVAAIDDPGRGAAFWIDAEEISVRRKRYQRPDQQDRRRIGARCSLRGGQRDPDPTDQRSKLAEKLGDEIGRAGGDEKSEGGAGAQARGHLASDVGRRHSVRGRTVKRAQACGRIRRIRDKRFRAGRNTSLPEAKSLRRDDG